MKGKGPLVLGSGLTDEFTSADELDMAMMSDQVLISHCQELPGSWVWPVLLSAGSVALREGKAAGNCRSKFTLCCISLTCRVGRAKQVVVMFQEARVGKEWKPVGKVWDKGGSCTPCSIAGVSSLPCPN
jgi:hypothetical protein